jgi:RNA-directed DNA polymerase
LPQGAPSSAYIGNLILYPVDADTHAYCLERGMRYTRFADDIAVSANYDCRHHWPQISEFFVRRRFTLSEAKTEFMCSSTRQVVTQLVVNDVLDVREEYVRMVHGIVVDLERRASSGYRPSSREMQSLRGRISFIQSINPSSASPLWRDLHRLKATRCLLS